MKQSQKTPPSGSDQRPASIAETLLSELRPGMSAAQLVRAVRAVHPEATKKEVIHAAFAAVIAIAEADPERARMMQDFALKNRGG